MATLEVLGMGCRSCIGLLKTVEEAVRLEGRSDRVEKVTDCNRILALDPWALPALAIDGKVVVAGLRRLANSNSGNGRGQRAIGGAGKVKTTVVDKCSS